MDRSPGGYKPARWFIRSAFHMERFRLEIDLNRSLIALIDLLDDSLARSEFIEVSEIKWFCDINIQCQKTKARFSVGLVALRQIKGTVENEKLWKSIRVNFEPMEDDSWMKAPSSIEQLHGSSHVLTLYSTIWNSELLISRFWSGVDFANSCLRTKLAVT